MFSTSFVDLTVDSIGIIVLQASCTTLPGVGPAIAKKLAQCGIYTIEDLLLHLPYRYQDRTRVTSIQDLRTEDWAVVMGRVCQTEITQGRRAFLNCYVEDKTGILTLRFFHFNQRQIQQLKASPYIRAFGEVRQFGQTLHMVHPEYQLIEDITHCPVEETLTPIYSTTQGLNQTRLRQLVKQALSLYQPNLHTLEWMSSDLLKQHGFLSLPDALSALHHPPPDVSIESLESGQHAGLKRLAFEELLAQQLSMQLARQERQSLKAPSMSQISHVLTAFQENLTFKLTHAQTRVVAEIHQDLRQQKPMLRLVQGDVGSGKTVISALAALMAISNGYQVAFMAPTDILSEQHALTLAQWFEPLGIPVYRLSGKMKATEKRQTLQALQSHEAPLVVGTHALFQQDVQFAKLGLVIIDEQHRFGVDQRALLQQKGQQENLQPHQLLMTATPIPRTLAMTQWNHLDLSIIDELPPGRTPITTAVLNQTKREQVIDRLSNAIQNGRQIYWVCTLIEDSEKLQCVAATETAEQLRSQLPQARIGLVHGRLNATEKDATMMAFKRGEIDLLVATTVIEVGVDVPNASLMIIENAERLGLSQLHQLRGRVGRGQAQSHCLLLYQPPLSLFSQERLRTMRDTTDGFIIAEKDLALRGSGEVLGTRQTGYRHYKVADLQRDQALIPQARHAAIRLLQEDPLTAEAIAYRWLGDFKRFIVT